VVVFFIGCFEGENTGRGGHYYSLLAMAKAIDCEYKIVVVGDFFPEPYKKEKNVVFINYRRFEAFKFNPHKDILLGDVSIVHAYDASSAIFASKLSAYKKVPLVVTKPGGSPLKNYSLAFENMVVFHGQDKDVLLKRRLSKPRNIELIPNRVLKPDNRSFCKRVNPFPSDSKVLFNIIRIARIGTMHKESISQSISLFKRLESEFGKGCVYLAIVGHVKDNNVFQDLKNEGAFSTSIKFYTSDEYCVNSSELIAYADIVVGTGRSFMEGVAYGKFVFFPVKDSELPCFATPDSYDVAFYKNFSSRVSCDDGLNIENSFSYFLSLTYCSKKRNDYLEWLEYIFRKDHEVCFGAKKMRLLYNKLKKKKSGYFSYYKYYSWSLFLSFATFLRRKFSSSPRSRMIK
jgi:hypothetical protein